MKRLGWLAAVLLLVGVLAACGSNNSGNAENTGGNNSGVSETGAASQEIVVEATNFKFDKEEYTAKSGEPVTIKLKTDGVHGIEISNTDVNLKGGEDATVTLEPGTYEIRCNVPCGNGHADMVSKLTVT